MKPNPRNYNAALYMRLSKDDGVTESSSIETQRKMLLSYSEENDFSVYDEYIDDGWTGTNFERPAFKRMIQDIENKKVDLVITKDLSRLGRDYIATGQYTEIYFPAKGIRYIAINDGYDSINAYTDIVPFKNVMNEMYARDTSKKIRSAFHTKMEAGLFIGNFAPYGYQKDPDNKNHLIVDTKAACIVQKIFSLASDGQTPVRIARYLNKKGIAAPAVYRCQSRCNLNVDMYSKRKEWTSAAISKMLRNIVYLGHLAQGKTTKVSFKSKVTVRNDKDDWVVVNDTHEPIISKEIFDIVWRRSLSRVCPSKGAFVNIFSGIAKCKDCGRNMSAVGTRKKGSIANLACGGYKLYGRLECSNHFIDFNILYNIVLESIREQTAISEQDKEKLIIELQKETKQKTDNTAVKKERETLRKKNDELDRIIEKLYEDNFQGVISDDRFRKLLSRYEAESKAVSEQIDTIDNLINEKNDLAIEFKQSCEKFSGLIEEYTDIQTLTPEILFKLIDRIEISQGRYKKTQSGKIKHQVIQIYFRFIGKQNIRKYII